MSLRGHAHAHDSGRVRLASAWLTWGAVAGTTAGELLQVAYTLSRPAVTAARLRLADGRELELTGLADRFELLLAPDTPAGWATITAELSDGTRTAVATLAVLLTGVTVAPLGPPSRPAGRPRRAPHRQISAPPATCRAAAGPPALTRRARPARMRVVCGPDARRVRSTPQRTTRAPLVRVHVTASVRVHATTRGDPRLVAVHAGAAGVSRRDGAALEEALLLGLM